MKIPLTPVHDKAPVFLMGREYLVAEMAVAMLGMASEGMRLRVLKSTLDELSDKDIAFLEAMFMDEGASNSTDMAARLAASASSVSNYKRRLLDAGVIQAVGRTGFDFALPQLREYLPEYIAANCL